MKFLIFSWAKGWFLRPNDLACVNIKVTTLSTCDVIAAPAGCCPLASESWSVVKVDEAERRWRPVAEITAGSKSSMESTLKRLELRVNKRSAGGIWSQLQAIELSVWSVVLRWFQNTDISFSLPGTWPLTYHCCRSNYFSNMIVRTVHGKIRSLWIKALRVPARAHRMS